MKTAADRLKFIREELHLSQEAFGRIAGVSKSAVSLWETGESKTLKSEPLLAIQQKTGYSAIWVSTGRGPKRVGDTTAGPQVGSIPLISWVQAGTWNGVEDHYHVGEGEKPVYTTKRVGPRAFALRVMGDSMENPKGRPSYPQGALIIVDPDRQAVNGSPVIAKLEDSQEATFKRLVIDGGKKWLEALNPKYPLIPVTQDTVICGVVIQTVIDEDEPWAAASNGP